MSEVYIARDDYDARPQIQAIDLLTTGYTMQFHNMHTAHVDNKLKHLPLFVEQHVS